MTPREKYNLAYRLTRMTKTYPKPYALLQLQESLSLDDKMIESIWTAVEWVFDKIFSQLLKYHRYYCWSDREKQRRFIEKRYEKYGIWL